MLTSTFPYFIKNQLIWRH